MLRFASLTILAVILCPSALADPVASVAVGPDGLVDPAKDPYYLWANLSTPTLPDERAERDCGAGTRQSLGQAALNVITPLSAWDPLVSPSASSWFPGCIWGDTDLVCGTPVPAPCPPAKGYAAYDVASGDYYVALSVSAAGGPSLIPQPRFTTDVGLGGNSGLGLRADCEYCPPPP